MFVTELNRVGISGARELQLSFIQPLPPQTLPEGLSVAISYDLPPAGDHSGEWETVTFRGGVVLADSPAPTAG